MNIPLSGSDHAQEFLVPYLQETSRILRDALRTLDPDADCQIAVAADLCVPHDVLRIFGGFATGCFVDWKCKTPVVPVDAFVNIDTSSIFVLTEDVRKRFVPEFFDLLRRRIETESSYVWNFNTGNHFIGLARRRSDGKWILVLHSNEKEFKYQYNGLAPKAGNWFMEDVVQYGEPHRPVRLLVGTKAVLFGQLAKMLEAYNVIRHRFVCQVIIDGLATVEQEFHKPHYYMPSASSVAMGCFLCTPGEIVTIFSRPGFPIDLFRPRSGGANQVRTFGGETVLLVPHGWGKTTMSPIEMAHDDGCLRVNGRRFDLAPQVSLGKHPELVLRSFDIEDSSPRSLYSRMRDHCPGELVDRLEQIAWYNKDGVACRDTTSGAA